MDIVSLRPEACQRLDTAPMFAVTVGSRRRRPNMRPKIAGEIMQVASATDSAQPEI
jgi:hypothetical protein